MDINDVVTKLRDAARGHKKWVGNARALIEGVPLDKDQVPLNSTECEFGKWYYGDGQDLREVPGFRDIETLHDDLHGTYMEIFVLLFGEVQEKESFLSRFVGTAHKTAETNKKSAMDKYTLLEKQSKLIVQQLVQLEKIITAMGPEQLERYRIAG